jgi:hypothetical protein
MIASLKLFSYQVNKFKDKGICRFPYRYFLRWLRSLGENHSSVSDEQPWLTFEVIDFLQKTIRKTHTVFEFGGGGSTLFFVHRAKEVVTAEHDKTWFLALQKVLEAKQIQNWNGKFVPAEKGDLFPVSNPSDPTHYSSQDESSKGLNFQGYASAIDEFPDAYFDFVLVDGRARPSCIIHSISKIKPGGYLVLDNSDRSYYYTSTREMLNLSFECKLDNFGPSPYLREFTKTSLWKKTI